MSNKNSLETAIIDVVKSGHQITFRSGLGDYIQVRLSNFGDDNKFFSTSRMQKPESLVDEIYRSKDVLERSIKEHNLERPPRVPIHLVGE